MKKKKEPAKVKRNMVRQNNCGFVLMLILIPLFIALSFAFSLISDCHNWVEAFDEAFINAIGIASQIVTSIMCCILSILGISFSLQSNDFLGVPIAKYYAMRKRSRFSFKCSALISIGLLIFSVVGYILGEIIICIGASFLSIVFGIYLLCTETPYLTMQENAMISIVKDRFISEYNGKIHPDDYQSRDYTEVLESLICNKNLKWVYDRMTVPNNSDYNKVLLYRLMDVQSNMSFHLDKIETQSELSKVTSNLLETTCDMTHSFFDITSVLGEKTKDYLHLLTRVFFRLIENPVSKEKTENRIADMVTSWYFPQETDVAKWDLYYSVITILIVEKIKKNDFSLIKKVKKSLSVSEFTLRKSGMTSRIFAMISFIMYYLAEIEYEVPQEIKENIKDFVSHSGIEDNTIILSWKDLFQGFSSGFAVTYSEFLSDFRKNEHYYDYMLASSRAHRVVLSEELATDWYLANFLNCEKDFYEFDFSKIFGESENEQLIYHLKQLQDECYPEREFEPSARIQNMAGFYQKSQPKFSVFRIVENHNHYFRNYIDALRKQELENRIQDAKNIKNQQLEDHFQPMLEQNVQSIFGFNQDIDVSKEKKLYFALGIDRDSRAINYDDCVVDWFINSLSLEIKENVIDKYSNIIKAGKSFTFKIADLCKNQIEYSSDDVVYYLNEITDPAIKAQLTEKINGAQKFKDVAYLFNKPTLILKDGFSFNCQLQFRAVDLSQEQISQKVEDYRRADGQYVYEGAFLTREELSRIIQDTQVIFQVIFSYKVHTYPGAIVMLDMYPDDNDESSDY